jgi:uncharacterized protein with NAD-binding domain and iron-sulfur cluster
VLRKAQGQAVSQSFGVVAIQSHGCFATLRALTREQIDKRLIVRHYLFEESEFLGRKAEFVDDALHDCSMRGVPSSFHSPLLALLIVILSQSEVVAGGSPAPGSKQHESGIPQSREAR